MTERENFEKYDNLSENELNSNYNKEVYVRNGVMIFVIEHNRNEKRGKKKKKKQINSETN